MGAGKSSIGRVLARRLGRRFVDLDRWIEKREGRRVAEIFATDGEAAFRAIEAQALKTVLDEREGPLVLALGGGAWVQPANAAALKAARAHVVFLDADPDVLRARCSVKMAKRPLFTDEEQFRRLYAARHASYMQADMRVDTGGKAVTAVADELAQLFRSGGSNGSQN